MKAIFDSYGGQVAPLAYHTWWPAGYDSFYLFNVPENDVRINYYQPGSKYVPTFRFDGKYIADPSDFATLDQWCVFARQTIDSLLADPSPIRINLDQYMSQDKDSVYVSFDVVCVDSAAGASLALQLAVVEDAHFYSFSSLVPKRWYHAMRDMFPDASGTPISLSPGDSLHYDWVYPIPDVFAQDDPVLVDDQWDMTTVVFIQRTATGKVHQAYAARVPDVSSVSRGETTEFLALGRSFPNPFTGETAIAYQLGKAGNVRLSVYTPEGRLVARLVDGYVEPGSHSAAWDGCDRFGNDVGSGVYYYRLVAQGETRTGRVVHLK
jgi:hypothetical protein